MKKRLLTGMGVLLFCALQTQAQAPQLNANNIDEVLNALTLEEKALLLVGGRNENYSGEGTTIGATKKLVYDAAGITQGVARLGIQPTVLADGPAGLRIASQRPDDPKTYYCTGFPVGLNLASSWDPELVAEVTGAMGNEVREYGVDVLLAPGMNIHRHPLCGRNFEYFSEDPLLSGKIAAAYVRGIQSNGVGACIKHFAANNQETNRNETDAHVSQRALREIYLKGFEIAVKESEPWTVMSSYNKLNGPYTQENRELLTTLLRDEWGFRGIVMTDWISPRNIAAQVHAGNDLMEPGFPRQSEELVERVKSGELSMEDVDACVRRMLEYIVKTPRQQGRGYSEAPDLQAHAALARRSGPDGMVLLKNAGGTLPLQAETNKRVALFGISSYNFVAGGFGSGNVNTAYTSQICQSLEEAGYEPDGELKALYESYREYAYNKLISEQGKNWYWGRPIVEEMPLARRCIEQQAERTDVAVLTLGRKVGEGHDRKREGDFDLTETERRLLNDVCEAFHAQGKRVVVVLNIGGVIETASWKGLPDAILLAWQPGQEGGRAVADVLTGAAYPSGKLTTTFPVACIDHASSLNFPMQGEKGGKRPRRNIDYTEYEEGIYVGYRYFESAGKAVSYPFGYGLGYTEFAYSAPRVKAVKGGLEASITVKNTGRSAGREVVQLYVTAPESGLEKPACELKAFGKTRELQPGESQTLTLFVSHYDLASYDESRQAWVSARGKYQLKFAASVQDVRATATYTLAREESVECHDILRPVKEVKEISLR